MTALLLILAAALILAIAALAFVTIRDRTSEALASNTVIVHTTDDKSIRGVLVAQHSDRLTLREALYLHSSGDQPVGGLVHVPRRSVSWIQEIVATEAK